MASTLSAASNEDYMHHILNHFVLIADAEAKIRFMVGGIAIANGYKYRMTTCASETWVELNASPNKYDVLITGISMPDDPQGEGILGPMNSNYEGLKLIQLIKETPRFSGLEVVVFSEANVRSEVEGLGAVYVGPWLHQLNELLREKSGLHQLD